jgi:WD40 repeat protein
MYQRRSIASLAVVSLLCTSLFAADASKVDSESPSVWVTGITQMGASGQFVAATANGLLLRESTVTSFDANDPSKLTDLYKHPAAAWCVDSSSDGKTVASVDYRGNLVTYDVAAKEPTTHEGAFERWCQAMVFSPDDKQVVGGNEAGKLIVWDIAGAKVNKSSEVDSHAITGLAFSNDGKQLAASDGAGHVHLLQWPSLKEIGKIEVGEETVWCVAFTQDDKQLYCGSSDRNLYRCDAKPDAKPVSVAKGKDWITRIAISSGGQVAASEVGGRLHFPSSGRTDSMEAESGVWALCWNGDGQLFAGTRKHGLVTAGQSWKWTEPKPADERPADKKPADEKPADEKPEMKTVEDADEENAVAAKPKESKRQKPKVDAKKTEESASGQEKKDAAK